MRKILIMIISVLFIPLSAYAFKLGDKLTYTIYITNQSTNTFLVNGQTIRPNTSKLVAAQSTDVIQNQSESFVHAVTIYSLANQETCTVTGHVDINLPGGFHMYSTDTNPNRCNASSFIYGGMDNLGLNVTVIN